MRGEYLMMLIFTRGTERGNSYYYCTVHGLPVARECSNSSAAPNATPEDMKSDF